MVEILGCQPNQPLNRKINPALLKRKTLMERQQQFHRRLRRGKGKVPGIKPLTYRIFKEKAIVLRKQTILLAHCMGKSDNNSTCNPGGDINNSSIRDSEGSIKQSVILMTVLRRQIKSGAGDPLEKVTGHQDDKPSTAETSTRKHPCWGNCCWRKRSLQQHSACDYTGEQPQQQLCLRNNPNKDLKKEDTTKPGI